MTARTCHEQSPLRQRLPQWCSEAARCRAGQRGSVVVFSLFICLALGVLVLSLAALVQLSNEVALSEEAGRSTLVRGEQALTRGLELCLADWGAPAADSADGVQVTVDECDPVEADRRQVTVQIPATADGPRESAPLEVSAVAERGLDGPTLPAAALVAECCIAEADRAQPPVDTCAGEEESEGWPAPVFLVSPELSADLAAAAVERLATAWRLDAGTALLLQSEQGAGSDLLVLQGDRGEILRLPAGDLHPDPPSDGHLLIVACGGADLDLRDQGQLNAVVLCDEGSVLLEGTVVRGAVFATGTVDLGANGAIRYDPGILAWATRGSITRVRLLPGSRLERWIP